MKRVTMVKLFVNDQDDALEFDTAKLGLIVAEDSKLGDYRWLLACLPDNQELALNLDFAKTDEQRALVGRQAAERTRAGPAASADFKPFLEATGHFNTDIEEMTHYQVAAATSIRERPPRAERSQ
jgi:hypothetical protein